MNVAALLARAVAIAPDAIDWPPVNVAALLARAVACPDKEIRVASPTARASSAATFTND